MEAKALAPNVFDVDDFLDLGYKAGLTALEPDLDVVLEAGGNGGTSSPVLSNLATRSLNEDLRPCKAVVDLGTVLLPCCNEDRVFAGPNAEPSGALKEPMVASANGSLYR